MDTQKINRRDVLKMTVLLLVNAALDGCGGSSEPAALKAAQATDEERDVMNKTQLLALFVSLPGRGALSGQHLNWHPEARPEVTQRPSSRCPSNRPSWGVSYGRGLSWRGWICWGFERGGC